MASKKRNFVIFASYLGLFCFVLMALASASAEKAYKSSGWDGSYGQQTVQHLHQNSKGGTYVGNASSQEEAKQMALKAGYPYYQYYPSTGECFGYK